MLHVLVSKMLARFPVSLRLGAESGLFRMWLRICAGRNMCDVIKEQICYTNAQLHFKIANAQPRDLRMCDFKMELRI